MTTAGETGERSKYIDRRYRELMMAEAEDIRAQVIDTARLAVEAYDSGEKKLGLIVIKESIRLAGGYSDLREQAGGDPLEAYELMAGLGMIKKLMEEDAEPELVWSAYYDL